MIKLTEYQKYALKKFDEHDKVILLWFRQSGKGQVMLESLTDFVEKNSNKTILFFNYSLNYSILFVDRIMREIPSLVIKKTAKEIKFINNNRLFFCSLRQDDLSSYFDYEPSLIFFDLHFSDRKTEINNLVFVKSKMKALKKCKWMVASSRIYSKFFEIIDSDDAFYINILSFEMFFNSKTPLGYEYLDGEYCYAREEFKHKHPKMIDFMGKNVIRKMKLKKIERRGNNKRR